MRKTEPNRLTVRATILLISAGSTSGTSSRPFGSQKSAAVSPMSIRRCARYSQTAGGLVGCHAGEDTQLDDFGCKRIIFTELRERVIQGQQVVRRGTAKQVAIGEFDPLPVAAMNRGPLSPRLIDQNASHGLGRSGKKMPAPVPLLTVLGAHEPQIGLVHEGRRLQRLAGFFLGEACRGQLPQFFVNEWQKLLRSRRLSLLDGTEDPR